MQGGWVQEVGGAWHGPVIRRDMDAGPVAVWMNRQDPWNAESAVFSPELLNCAASNLNNVCNVIK